MSRPRAEYEYNYQHTPIPMTTSRFWSQVKVGDKDECWNWVGTPLRKDGYGQVWMIQDGDFVKVLSHRLAYQFAYGEIPEGMYVLHTCDNRSCNNYNHLFVGTLEDNRKDMVNKGRAWYQNRNKP